MLAVAVFCCTWRNASLWYEWIPCGMVLFLANVLRFAWIVYWMRIDVDLFGCGVPEFAPMWANGLVLSEFEFWTTQTILLHNQFSVVCALVRFLIEPIN